MADKARDAFGGEPPANAHGDGVAKRGGYGAGGLGAGADRARRGEAGQDADGWDAPGVTPGGRRTGSPDDGPRTAMDDEGEPDPEPKPRGG